MVYLQAPVLSLSRREPDQSSRIACVSIVCGNTFWNLGPPTPAVGQAERNRRVLHTLSFLNRWEATLLDPEYVSKQL